MSIIRMVLFASFVGIDLIWLFTFLAQPSRFQSTYRTGIRSIRII